MIIQVRQRQTTNQGGGGEDDDDDESSKIPSILKKEESLKHNEGKNIDFCFLHILCKLFRLKIEWKENEIHAFTEALEKFNDDWTQIAKYVHRSEQSCRAFYQKYRKKNVLPEDERIDEDNGSISGSEDIDRRVTIPVKSREIDEGKRLNFDGCIHSNFVLSDNEDEPQKTITNEDSNDSAHGMVIDEVDEEASVIEEKKSVSTGLTTISSLVEKEISKTLQQSEKRAINPNISPNKPPPPAISINSIPPPPLVTLIKSRSPPVHSHMNKGSIMRGTPISPSNKPISIDTSTMHSHHYSSPRTEYPHHSSHVESSKVSDQQQQQQQLYLQQQAAYMRHYSQNNFPPHHRSSSSNPPSQPTPNKSLAVDTSNNETYETLRADFVTSRYLTTTHSPNHER